MARVDPADDSVRRFVVLHYRYDPERHERRQVVVAAFTTKREYKKCLAEVSAGIERRRASGEQADPREYASGIVHEPGYHRQQAIGRLVGRAIQHGVAPGRLADLELPPNMAVLFTRRGEPPQAPVTRRGEPPQAPGR